MGWIYKKPLKIGFFKPLSLIDALCLDSQPQMEKNKIMASQKNLKLASKQIIQKPCLRESAKALDFYRTYKEIADVSEKIDMAMGKKQTYKYSSGSTQNCEINRHTIPPTTKSYKLIQS